MSHLLLIILEISLLFSKQTSTLLINIKWNILKLENFGLAVDNL